MKKRKSERKYTAKNERSPPKRTSFVRFQRKVIAFEV